MESLTLQRFGAEREWNSSTGKDEWVGGICKSCYYSSDYIHVVVITKDLDLELWMWDKKDDDNWRGVQDIPTLESFRSQKIWNATEYYSTVTQHSGSPKIPLILKGLRECEWYQDGADNNLNSLVESFRSVNSNGERYIAQTVDAETALLNIQNHIEETKRNTEAERKRVQLQAAERKRVQAEKATREAAEKAQREVAEKAQREAAERERVLEAEAKAAEAKAERERVREAEAKAAKAEAERKRVLEAKAKAKRKRVLEAKAEAERKRVLKAFLKAENERLENIKREAEEHAKRLGRKRRKEERLARQKSRLEDERKAQQERHREKQARVLHRFGADTQDYWERDHARKSEKKVSFGHQKTQPFKGSDSPSEMLRRPVDNRPVYDIRTGEKGRLLCMPMGMDRKAKVFWENSLETSPSDKDKNKNASDWTGRWIRVVDTEYSVEHKVLEDDGKRVRIDYVINGKKICWLLKGTVQLVLGIIPKKYIVREVELKYLCRPWDTKRNEVRKGLVVYRKEIRTGTLAKGEVERKCFWWRVRVKWLTGKEKGRSTKIKTGKLYLAMDQKCWPKGNVAIPLTRLKLNRHSNRNVRQNRRLSC